MYTNAFVLQVCKKKYFELLSWELFFFINLDSILRWPMGPRLLDSDHDDCFLNDFCDFYMMFYMALVCFDINLNVSISRTRNVRPYTTTNVRSKMTEHMRMYMTTNVRSTCLSGSFLIAWKFRISVYPWYSPTVLFFLDFMFICNYSVPRKFSIVFQDSMNIWNLCVPPKFSNVPFLLDLMFFQNSSVHPKFSNVPLFRITWQFRICVFPAFLECPVFSGSHIFLELQALLSPGLEIHSAVYSGCSIRFLRFLFSISCEAIFDQGRFA